MRKLGTTFEITKQRQIKCICNFDINYSMPINHISQYFTSKRKLIPHYGTFKVHFALLCKTDFFGPQGNTVCITHKCFSYLVQYSIKSFIGKINKTASFKDHTNVKAACLTFRIMTDICQKSHEKYRGSTYCTKANMTQQGV